MALLPILEFPDPRLRTKAVPVEAANVTTAEFQRLLDDMFETMYDAPGIGLAASQVDVHQRFMVIDISEEKNQPQVFINPELSDKAGEQVYQEGCLSVPGIFADVTRADEITVRFLDRQGQPQGQGAKQGTWAAIKKDLPPRTWLGWKNFEHEDKPMLTPQQTASQVKPTPNFISYQ